MARILPPGPERADGVGDEPQCQTIRAVDRAPVLLPPVVILTNPEEVDKSVASDGTTSPQRPPLPEGYAWRRAELQLVERLGALPGDQVAVIAPPTHDPTAHLVKRLPRIDWLQVAGGPFGWDPKNEELSERLETDPLSPALEEESLEAVLVVLAVPLLDPETHIRFVHAWTQVLAPFGKWLSLSCLKDSHDPRLQEAEEALKTNGFTRVRTNRLGGGGGSTTLAITSGRKE